MPDTAIALIAHIQAQLVAAHIHEQRNDAAAQAQALAEAGDDVEALARFTGLPGAHQQRADYFGYVGREDDVLNEWRTAIQSESANDDAYRLYTYALYRSGQYEEVLATLDKWAKQGDNVSALLTHGLLLILMAPQDAPAGAMAAYRQAMAFEGSSMVILWHQMIPRLLGDEATVRAACPELRERFARLPDWVLDWYQNILDFQCGGLPASNLIAAAGASRMPQCEAYFLMGVASLAEGDRAAATVHFQSAIDTRVYMFWDWGWSQLLIEKLEKDPTWPPWIPMREASTESPAVDRTGEAPNG